MRNSKVGHSYLGYVAVGTRCNQVRVCLSAAGPTTATREARQARGGLSQASASSSRNITMDAIKQDNGSHVLVLPPHARNR